MSFPAPPSPVDLQEVVRGLRALDLHGRRQPRNVHRTRVRRDVDRVVAAGAVDRRRVDRSVGGEIEHDVLDVGRGQVVHDRVVDAAERAEIDPLGVVDVHRDVRDVAEELQTVAVRREVELLRASGAVEDHRVRAGLAFHLVAAVAGVPRERVVAGAHQRHVGASVSVDRVVLAPAEQRVAAVAAVDGVVARTAVERQLGERGKPDSGLERVIACQGLDRQRLRVDDVDRHGGWAARDGDVSGDP